MPDSTSAASEPSPSIDPRELHDQLEGVRSIHALMLNRLSAAEAAGDLVPAAPSRLAGWSVGHVLTHLARHADSITRVLDGALAGGVESRYPGGIAQRNDDIAAGASRPIHAQLDDLRASNARLERALERMTPAAWLGSCLAFGAPQPISDLPLTRWRESAVHLSDVGLSNFTIDDWSPDYVARDLAHHLAAHHLAAHHLAGQGSPASLPAPIAARSPLRQLAWLHARLPACGPAWNAATLRPDWRRPFSPEEIEGLRGALASFRTASPGLDLEAMTPDTFPLTSALDALVHEVRFELVDNTGVAAFENFPVDEFSDDELRAIWWGLSCAIGTPVSQSRRGDLIGDVRDLGTGISGPVGRGYTSNTELNFHADASDVSGLFFLRTARQGGVTRIASAIETHDALARRRPDALAELYRPLPWSWQGNQPEGEQAWYAMPVFGLVDDEISCAYVRTNILLAPQNAGAPDLRPEQIEAVQMLVETASEPSMWVEHAFGPGAMLFVHNHTTLHLRTAFTDWDEPERKRHLLRIWLSPPNSRQLPQSFGTFFADLSTGSTRGGYPSATGRHVFATPAL